MMQMNTPPIKSIRVTVPVTPEVLALFQRLSRTSGNSVGRCMGDWLDETREGLVPMIEIMERFKSGPRSAVQALQLHANALTDMAAEVVAEAMRIDPETGSSAGTPAERGGRTPAPVFTGKGGLTPPSSNTGGKVPLKAKKPKKSGD